MKTIIIVLCLIPSICLGQLWIEPQINYMTYSNSDMDGSRVQFKALAGYKYFYLWGSLDTENSIDYGGQEGVSFKVPAIGIGARIPLVKYLSAYIEGGYFKPDADESWHRQDAVWEGMHYYAIDKVSGQQPGRWFDKARMEVDGGFGGEVGAGLDFPLGHGFALTGKAGYRYLKVDQHVWLKWDDRSDAWWEFDDQLDLSGWVMGVGLRYAF